MRCQVLAIERNRLLDAALALMQLAQLERHLSELRIQRGSFAVGPGGFVEALESRQ